MHLCKSADPSRRVVAIVLCKIQTVPKIQNPKSEIQNPKSKVQNPKSKIQNPKSKIQNPKSKIQNPKSKIQTAAFGAATKRMDTKTIQNPKSKIQNPKSKRLFWILGFGFGRRGWGRRWLCSKCSCMGGLATRIWPSWWRPKLVSRRSEARSPPRAFQIGHRFPGEDFAGNRAPVSSPVSWKSGLNFQRNYHEK